MQKYSTTQRTKIVELYFENGQSIVRTQRAYMCHYQVRNPPSKSAIICLIHRFQQQGSVVDLPRLGRARSVRTLENRDRIEQSIQQYGTASTRHHSRELDIPRTSLQRLQKDLHMYPYKVQLVQEIKPIDYQQCWDYAVHFKDMARDNNESLHKFIVSDEAHFHLSGFASKQNCRFGGTKNPRAICTQNEST